jgi:YaaC-like protein
LAANPGGRPPDARVGESLAVAGRVVVPGAGSHERVLSPRVTMADLWASLDVAATAEGLKSTAAAHGTSIDSAAGKRLAAYLAQASQYYKALPFLDPVAKPLMAYYFALNLTKAYLTVREPAFTAVNVRHGASDAYKPGQRYRFTQERVRIESPGVLQKLALSTGMEFCWKQNEELQLSKMVAYLAEGADLYSDAFGTKPKLLPITQARILRASVGGGQNEAWIAVDVSRLLLKERGLSARGVLGAAKIFSSNFQLVFDQADTDTVTYESKNPIQFKKAVQVLGRLRAEFDRALLLRNRSTGGGVDYIVLSSRPKLLSMEALTFAVLLHLSNMVRYRPQQVEALRGSKYWWLFTSWVDRACENFLLSIASRISLEEHVIR